MQPINKVRGALGAILLASGAAPAAAQYGSAPQAPPSAAAPSGQPAAPAAPAATAPAEVLRAVACAIGRDANGGNALLATLPFSAEERTQAGAFVRVAQRCLRLREAIATSAFSLRGVVAEFLYESRFAAPVAARSPALGARPLPRAAPGTDPQIVDALAPMFALVDCATPRQPDLVRALLATEPRSAAETAALTAFNPTFIACVPAGSQLRIDPRVMRNFFAEALYRWSVVQRDGPASPWAAPAAAAPPPAAQ
jgi:hypothetical protein